MAPTEREIYIDSVNTWKQLYKAHSQKSRELKTKYSELQREYAKDPNPNKGTYHIYEAHRDLLVARTKATEMIEERIAGKKQAQIQYLASRQ